MPYYDLNVPWTQDDPQLPRTLAFLGELGYNVIALSHSVSGKLPSDLSCPIPQKLPFETRPNLQVLRRCTLSIADPSQNHRIASISSNYDILAIRPLNEKSLQQACQSLECDIISLDLTRRLEYHFKMKMLAGAIERGIKIEICYSPAILAGDVNARRNLISNATQLIRATRGRGLIISSEATRAAGCRAPDDVINLAAVWGLGQERGKEAIDKLARHAAVSSQLKRSSFRGAVDLVYGGPQVQEKPEKQDEKKPVQEKKRKAEEDNPIMTKPLSKREQKRRKKAAARADAAAATTTTATTTSTPAQ